MNQSIIQSSKTVVALYHSHHNLPFGFSPENPYDIFCPDKHRNFIVDSYRSIGRVSIRQGLADSHFMFPILEGLQNLNLPNIMAHVSIYFSVKTKSLISGKPIWVQLSTKPHDGDENAMPIVVKDDKIMVENLCINLTNNGTHSPLDFIGDEVVPGEGTPAFWTKFFLEKLMAERAESHQIYTEAKRRQRLLLEVTNP